MGVASGGNEEAQNREHLRTSGARERILDASYELFSHHGVHAVGIDRVIAAADVAKATLYNHFPSKEALVIAFLDLREERWTHSWLVTEVERLAATPEERALAIFDALDEWFHRSDFEGCSFINTLLEIGDDASPVHKEAVRHLAVLRGIFADYAAQAGVSDPEEMGYLLQTLAIGSIVSARRADLEAARRVRPLVASMLAGSR